MKKILRTEAALFICFGVLSGCGGNVTTVSESTNVLEETTAETLETSETAAAAFQPETTEVVTTVSEETSAVSETETSEETEWQQPSYEIVDMSGYTGNFYEWEYDYDIVAYDRESFAGGEDIINTAAQAVKENAVYTVNEKEYKYAEIAQLAENAEKSEEYDGYIFEVDGERVMLYNDVYERFADENGKLEPQLAEGVYEDYDGDGKKESFLCFNLFNLYGEFSDTICCAAFVDSEGNAELLPEASGEIFDSGKTLNPMRYSGFIHMCTAFGVNNITHHSEIYAVENGKAVHKKSMFSPGDPFCGAFMLESAAQAPGSWISFWNETDGKYCTLKSEKITDEDAEELYNSAAFGTLSELYESAEQLKGRSGVTGKRFYSVSSGGFWIEAFERVNGKFESSEYAILCPYYSNEIYAVGIDINKAQTEMIRLEK